MASSDSPIPRSAASSVIAARWSEIRWSSPGSAISTSRSGVNPLASASVSS